MLTVEVETGGGSSDLGGECGEGFFKGCWRGVLGLRMRFNCELVDWRLAVMGTYPEGPQGHHDGLSA